MPLTPTRRAIPTLPTHPRTWANGDRGPLATKRLKVAAEAKARAAALDAKAEFTAVLGLFDEFAEFITTQKDHRDVGHPAMNLTGTLKPCQVEALRWLVSVFAEGQSAILAQDSGWGKAVQVSEPWFRALP